MAASRIHVGTSGWTYDSWTGVFYPEDVKGSERLPYYAGRYDTVEANVTFYRFPTAAMINAWNRELGPGFHLVVKGSRAVTHRKGLGEAEDLTRRFVESVRPLKRLKAILWQFPPSLKKDPEKLRRFLEMLPSGVRHALEFRHESWWDEETAKLLARRRAAFVAVSHPRLPKGVIPTAKFLYLRFHGEGRRLYDYHYSDQELSAWARRVEPHLEGRELYAYFNNDVGGKAVGNARRFREILEGKA